MFLTTQTAEIENDICNTRTINNSREIVALLCMQKDGVKSVTQYSSPVLSI
jgi:hypothetical protein